MRMSAGANETDKQLGKRVKNIAATIPQGGPAKPKPREKTEFVFPSTSRPPKEGFDIRTIHGEGDPAAEIWFDRREAGEVEIKSLEKSTLRPGRNLRRSLFSRHRVRAVFPQLETEIGMLLER